MSYIKNQARLTGMRQELYINQSQTLIHGETANY